MGVTGFTNRTGDITGAFSDGAILFPLLVALTLQTGMDGTILLGTAGIAYIVAGLVFRVPMAVQPLKSVVIAALAVGATAAEIRFSGLAVGIVCLTLSFMYANRLASMVPRHLVHGLQLGLGIILMLKGMKWGIETGNTFSILIFIVLTILMLAIGEKTKKPVLGWVAATGLLVAVFFAVREPILFSAMSEFHDSGLIRVDIILALVLPQLALTLTNSVVATHDVAHRYFGEKAKQVTPTNLLRSIGIGNVLTAAAGGLPYCHGSGGLTAHVKGGAKSYVSNLIIGGTLVILALISWAMHIPLIPAYPQTLMAALIFVTGFFHVKLAAPSWGKTNLRWMLIIMAAAALLTQNMLWILVVGVLAEVIRQFNPHKKGTPPFRTCCSHMQYQDRRNGRVKKNLSM